MLDEAYWALEAIRQGENGKLGGHDRWVDAFLACRWVVRCYDGTLALTDSGLAACKDLARDRLARAA